jgi:hypothetical protein
MSGPNPGEKDEHEGERRNRLLNRRQNEGRTRRCDLLRCSPPSREFDPVFYRERRAPRYSRARPSSSPISDWTLPESAGNCSCPGGPGRSPGASASSSRSSSPRSRKMPPHSVQRSRVMPLRSRLVVERETSLDVSVEFRCCSRATHVCLPGPRRKGERHSNPRGNQIRAPLRSTAFAASDLRPIAFRNVVRGQARPDPACLLRPPASRLSSVALRRALSPLRSADHPLEVHRLPATHARHQAAMQRMGQPILPRRAFGLHQLRPGNPGKSPGFRLGLLDPGPAPH